jgi:hypothetical protein
MTSFTPQVATPCAAPPDPTKHVNYTHGMVLGVDDFTQEFAYLSGRDQWLARDLIGYGTVCGLHVSRETDARGLRVVVTPGVALNPRGQLIRVTSAQCAYLNDWLAAHTPQVMEHLGSPAGDVARLYVVLCYRECPTDAEPIPGEPCRTVEESMAPSRLTEDFKLELRFEAPDQREEDAIRDFVAWLRQVDISDAPGGATLEAFEQAIRDAAELIGSPLGTPPDFMYGSPPAWLRIHVADAPEYLRAAFRIWTTELRGRWKAAGCTGFPNDDCVLLAQLDVPLLRLPGQWQVDPTRLIEVHEERRPYLMHLRLLQEWLLAGRREALPADVVTDETAFGQSPAAGTSESYSRADHTHGTPPLPAIPAPGDGVISETAFGLASNAGASPNFSRADHTHGTPPAPPAVLPSATVIAETAFGQAANPGGAAELSRGDHTHGTPTLPAIPTPGDTVTPEIAFGQAANPGGAAEFSRADHTHGTPAAPGVVGDVVERPSAAVRFGIVAAGTVRGDNGNRQPVYNGLRVTGAGGAGQISLTFDGYEEPPRVDGRFQYIVKALPVFNDLFQTNVVVNFQEFSPDPNVGFVLRVTDITGNPINPDRLMNLELMIEVSQFPFRQRGEE